MRTHWGIRSGVDPSGYIAEDEVDEANTILNELQQYNIHIKVDWGRTLGIGGDETIWYPGLWELDELRAIRGAVTRLAQVFGGTSIPDKMINVKRIDLNGIADTVRDTIRIKNNFLDAAMPHVAFVHEFAHAWDYLNDGKLSDGLVEFRGNEPGPTAYGSGTGLGTWATDPDAEEWAESFAAYIYPEYIVYLRTAGSIDYENESVWQATLNRRPEYRHDTLRRPGLGQLHEAYVALQINGPFWPYVR